MNTHTHTHTHAEEFVAHQGSVNCIKIGRKSSGVLVTGGEDKKVNLWTIGTQTRTLVRATWLVYKCMFQQSGGAQLWSCRTANAEYTKVACVFANPHHYVGTAAFTLSFLTHHTEPARPPEPSGECDL